ncbi:THAP domain-containing protein 1-like isoform X1 [Schistocerca serialis cubense]|uniref:THAP domain-containing protein 1-like isoform X1 n=1 Tax=Schistocerca serialis cubense TaxID=2023355 RepID=UPI00214EF860|nr:THAP domain-containing protein 1-like isoform X1 [Schistocerca serialis cubense]XP_049945537.1 THAP domain-containing protein 1-like isoform X1 [Schistocerca serialis cubense]
MVISCSAFKRTKRWSKESDLPFHRFPLKHPELLKKWITSVKRKDFKPTSCSFLCGNLFRQDDYVVSPGTWKKRLRHEAVPSIFDFPTHLMPPNKQPRRHVRILSDNDASPFERCVLESVLDLPSAEATDCVENFVNENSSVESMSHLSNAEAANCVEISAVGSQVIDCGIQSKVEMEDKATKTCNFFSDIVHELKR